MVVFIIAGVFIGFVLTFIMAFWMSRYDFYAIYDFEDYIKAVPLLMLIFGLVGYGLGNICDIDYTTTYDKRINLLETEFSCEVSGNNKIIHVNGYGYNINSIETISGDGLYIEVYKNTTKVRKNNFYTSKLVIGNRANNEQINMLFKGNIITDNNFNSNYTKQEREEKELYASIEGDGREENKIAQSVMETESRSENGNQAEIFCIQCAEYLEEKVNYCPSCGYKVAN